MRSYSGEPVVGFGEGLDVGPIDDLMIWNADAMRRLFGEARRIALVGNGTVEADSTPRIAECDLVVRFNNWATRAECREKTLPHGTLRCDVLVTHLDLHSPNMGQGDVAAPKLVVIGIPAPFHIDSNPVKLANRHTGTPVAMVNPYWNRQLCQALALESEGWKHPLPTLGITALYHLARMTGAGIAGENVAGTLRVPCPSGSAKAYGSTSECGPANRQAATAQGTVPATLPFAATFYVCGFDWHFDPAADTIQGHAIDVPQLPRNFHHWYVKEAVWVSRNLYGRPEWQFSERAERTLRRLHGKHFTWEAAGEQLGVSRPCLGAESEKQAMGNSECGMGNETPAQPIADMGYSVNSGAPDPNTLNGYSESSGGANGSGLTYVDAANAKVVKRTTPRFDSASGSQVDYRREDRRYSELYRRGYGCGPVGGLLKWAKANGVEMEGKRVVDCGCGHATLLQHVAQFERFVGVDVAGYQIGVCRKKYAGRTGAEFVHGSLDRLPLADGEFDVAWCCDVLEHLPEAGAIETIGELFRVGRQVVVSISTRPSRNLDAEGNNLHLTVRPADWWLAAFAQRGRITAQKIGGDCVWAIGEQTAPKTKRDLDIGRPSS